MKTNSRLSLSPLSPDQFLPSISLWTRLGGLVLIGTVFVTITVAALLKFNVTVKAAAKVRPSGELRLVQTDVEGTIDRINVKVNQEVNRGDVIASLNVSRLENQKSQLLANIKQSQIQLAQINDQIQLLDSQIIAEKRSLNQEISIAQVEVNRTQRDYQEQETTAQANLAEAEAAFNLARSEMQRYQDLADTGAITQMQVEEKLANMQSATARMLRAKAALNPSKASVEIAQEKVIQEQARIRASLANFNREKKSLLQNLSVVQAQITGEQKQLQQLENEKQRSVIRATSDGVILQLNLRNPQQVVRLGETIAEIAPRDKDLVIKASVATQDIDQVKLGQLSQMRIDACPYPDYGILEGKVTGISPDAIANPLSNNTSSPYFEVRIEPVGNVLTNGTRQCQLQPGMEAEAHIVSKEETLLQFILTKARLLSDL